MVHVRHAKTFSIGEQIGEWQNKWQDSLDEMMKETDFYEDET